MKILVISSNLIGDTVLSTGVIKYFLNRYPNSYFTFAIGPTSSQLYENFPNLEKIIIIKKKKYNFHWFEIFLQCFKVKWDIIIDFRSSLICYFLFHKKKFIFKKNNKFHQLEQLENYFKFNCSNLEIHNSINELKIAANFIDNQYKHVVICPGGNWKPKIWPSNKYNQLIKKINERFNNTKFIIVGSAEEKKLYFNAVTKNINKNLIIDLMGDTLTLTSSYMKKSSLFVGNDSGLMHLSVASKLKTIGLFGPTNDKIYSPKGHNCYVVRTKENYQDLRKSINIIDQSYMNSIEVEDIIDLIIKNKLL